MKVFLSFLFLFLTVLGNANNKLDQNIKIVFRFDDYQLIPTQFYDSLFTTFKNNDVPLCIILP